MSRILSPMLERVELGSVPGAQDRITRPNVHTRNIAQAVCVDGHREEKRGRGEIGELNARMILRMPEGGHLQDAWVPVADSAVLLREDRVRHDAIQRLVSAIAHNDTIIVLVLKPLIEESVDVLN